MLVRGVVSLREARTTPHEPHEPQGHGETHPPSVAVLSLTRDRLAYTQHCFETLRQYAGCEYDHYVFDNGSTDGTWEWLDRNMRQEISRSTDGNIGISRAMNYLLDLAKERGPYDWYVKFDNDCELTTPNTLRDACRNPAWILSPHIQGLDSPPAIEQEADVDGVRVGETTILGGIFMAVHAEIFDHYRHDENNPVWGMDDVRLVEWFRGRGGRVGYMLDYPANHYLTTAGQREDNIGDYYTRKELEYGA